MVALVAMDWLYNQHVYSAVTRPLIGSTKCSRCDGFPTAPTYARAYSLCDSGDPDTKIRPALAMVNVVGVWKCPT